MPCQQVHITTALSSCLPLRYIIIVPPLYFIYIWRYVSLHKMRFHIFTISRCCWPVTFQCPRRTDIWLFHAWHFHKISLLINDYDDVSVRDDIFTCDIELLQEYSLLWRQIYLSRAIIGVTPLAWAYVKSADAYFPSRARPLYRIPSAAWCSIGLITAVIIVSLVRACCRKWRDTPSPNYTDGVLKPGLYRPFCMRPQEINGGAHL